MSTLAEIEQAVETLPRKQQESLLRRLVARLGSGPSCYDGEPRIFRGVGTSRRERETRSLHEQDASRRLGAEADRALVTAVLADTGAIVSP